MRTLLFGVLWVATLGIMALIASAYQNWNKSGSILIELPILSHSMCNDAWTQEVNMVLPAGSYIISLCCQVTNDRIKAEFDESLVSISGLVWSGQEEMSFSKSIILNSDSINDLIDRIERLVAAQGYEMGGKYPVTHLQFGGAALWQASDVWSISSDYSNITMAIHVDGCLPNVGAWSIRIESFRG